MLIDYGYSVKEKKRVVTNKKALRIVKNHACSEYTKIINNFNTVTFVSEYVKCPICCSTISVKEVYPGCDVPITKEKMDGFFHPDPQMHFGNTDNNNSLVINHATFNNTNKFHCPYCDNEILKGTEKRHLILNEEKEKAIVKVQIKNIKEIISCIFTLCNEYVVDLSPILDIAFWEVFTLDLKKGTAHLSFEDGNYKSLISKDITSSFHEIDDVCFTIIANNKTALKFLTSKLKPYWDIDFPYDTNFIELSDIITINRFKGFNLEFYNSIPFLKTSFDIEPGFLNTVSYLKDYKTAVKYLESSRIPNTKSIRRSLFESMGLLFYIKELESLYSDLENIDLFNKLIRIKPENLLVLLSNIHCYPSINVWIRHFTENDKNKRVFLEYVERGISGTIAYAKNYALMSNSMMSIENQKSTSEIAEEIFRHEFSPFRYSYIDYSLPLRLEDMSLEDRINDFVFRYIKSTNEAIRVSEELDNCLDGRVIGDKAVITMHRGIKTVAAIELSYNGTFITQALVINNEPIENDNTVFRAFEKWRLKHKLRVAEW